jgi:hypothetical protein
VSRIIFDTSLQYAILLNRVSHSLEQSIGLTTRSTTSKNIPVPSSDLDTDRTPKHPSWQTLPTSYRPYTLLVYVGMGKLPKAHDLIGLFPTSPQISILYRQYAYPTYQEHSFHSCYLVPTAESTLLTTLATISELIRILQTWQATATAQPQTTSQKTSQTNTRPRAWASQTRTARTRTRIRNTGLVRQAALDLVSPSPSPLPSSPFLLHFPHPYHKSEGGGVLLIVTRQQIRPVLLHYHIQR